MLDEIDALVALQMFGTVSEAATRLRLTQSAVSKRIQSLQARLGLTLVEPDGRRLRLTAPAIGFLERARPLVAELRGLAQPAARAESCSFSLALADSIASSWGPQVVRRALAGLPRVTLALHAHRSILVIESVRLGRYDIGLCTEPPAARDLVHHALADEPLVIVHSRLAARAKKGPLLAIEPTSATWRAVHPSLQARHPQLLRDVIFVESFGAVLEMARAGFGDGLLPLGMTARLPRRAFHVLDGVQRHITLLTRKTVNQLPGYTALRQHLTLAAGAHFRGDRHRP
jgi:DNA-binding transcriptional LysR family regulator